MSDWNQSSGLEDPLQVYSGLSLFPRTLKSLSIPLPPPRLQQSDDLQQTHSFLESMPSKFQSELAEQTKAILDSSSELLNPGIPVNVVSKDDSQGIEMNPIANQRERRQGLGRKRARFSLKPTTSQPNPNVDEPSFDDSKYHNPEDFFAAYEKFENAKREWQKQTGTSLTHTHQNQPEIRPRRPGISGRRRVSYNHRYSTDGVNLEASDGELVSPCDESLLKNNTANVTTVDEESTDPSTETEKNVESILGDLLSCSPELVGDVNLLEECLQIKPIDTEKLSLPELQDVRKSNFMAPQRYSSKPRTVLSDIRNMLKGIRSETGRKNTQTPSPLQSPGDSLSSQIKHMSPSNLQDQFSFPDRNHLLPGDISTRALGQQSSEVDAAKGSNIYSRSSATISGDDIDNVFPSNVGYGDIGPVNKSVEKTSGELESDTHTDLSRPVSSSAEGTLGDGMNDSVMYRNPIRSKLNVDIQSEANDGDIPISESETCRDLTRSENDPDICAGEANQLDGLAEDSFRVETRRDDFTVEKDFIPSQQDESSKSPNGAQEQHSTVNGSPEYVENLQEQHGNQNENDGLAHGLQENVQGVRYSSEELMTKGGNRISHERKGKKRNKKGSDESEGSKRMKTLSGEGGSSEQTERISHENKENKRRKTVSRESKAFSRRKSLAAAGTEWESGVRRSTRIKSRPLEYWKGERFLYGRIHESLATVIGVKYESPTMAAKGNREKPRLKVKSYVSNEYKELIERAALH